jgi:hypothetical protein
MWNMHGADHVVFCFDGSRDNQWRVGLYEGYKRNRITRKINLSEREIEDDRLFFEAVNDLKCFLEDKTNATVLQNDSLEADDLISFWIQAHPKDEHIIISSDTDYIQLLKNPLVSIYNGIKKIRIDQTGVYNDKGQVMEFIIKSNASLSVKGINEAFRPETDWYEWATFLKFVRGDTSDNIFPAYPGVRIKGSSKKIGVKDAFEDRNTQGYNWNNFMLQRWTDADGKEHVVRDCIERNRQLIDLYKHPDDVKEKGLQTIANALGRKKVQNVGVHFLKFCSRWDLQRLSDTPTDYAKIFNAGYQG